MCREGKNIRAHYLCAIAFVKGCVGDGKEVGSGNKNIARQAHGCLPERRLRLYARGALWGHRGSCSLLFECGSTSRSLPRLERTRARAAPLFGPLLPGSPGHTHRYNRLSFLPCIFYMRRIQYGNSDRFWDRRFRRHTRSWPGHHRNRFLDQRRLLADCFEQIWPVLRGAGGRQSCHCSAKVTVLRHV